LALIPVFLVIALSSHHGQNALAVVIFAVVGWADYLDGFAARLTGQYSRMGALLDPVIDRLLIISGMAVCFDFSLLPRWAIILVLARELFMLVASRYGLRRSVDIKINWAGRLGVALIMLYAGLALSLTASVLYVRRGWAELRQLSGSD
jgi:cardiolipin synthase